MKKFTITNADNTKMNVDLVRYFKFKNDCYLIYTLNEVDEKGYLKLYLLKVMEELGVPVIHNIRDDREWAGMQGVVKKVLKEIKSNKRKFLKDLDYNNIQKIKIVEPRFFKLDKKLVDVLASNYEIDKINESFSENNNLPNFTSTLSTPDVNIENLDNSDSIVTNSTQNEGVKSLPPDMESSNLEPMEETLLKQGAFNPISVSEISIDSTINDVEPIHANVEQEKAEVNAVSDEVNTSDSDKDVKNDVINMNDVNNEDNNEINESIVLNQESDIMKENSDVVSDNKSMNVQDHQIDYEKLYLAEKEEKEAINLVMNDLLEQLTKYKNRYGELEK